jgi:hypothetical protein
MVDGISFSLCHTGHLSGYHTSGRECGAQLDGVPHSRPRGKGKERAGTCHRCSGEGEITVLDLTLGVKLARPWTFLLRWLVGWLVGALYRTHCSTSSRANILNVLPLDTLRLSLESLAADVIGYNSFPPSHYMSAPLSLANAQALVNVEQPGPCQIRCTTLRPQQAPQS